MTEDEIVKHIQGFTHELAMKAACGEVRGIAIAVVDEQGRGMGQYFYTGAARKPLVAEYALLSHILAQGALNTSVPIIVQDVKVESAEELHVALGPRKPVKRNRPR
jgi:hypothetical protein